MLHLSSVETFNSKLLETNYQRRGHDQKTHDKSRNPQFISFWFGKLIASVRDDTKNETVELFSINWSLNLFERTAFTTICQLLTSDEIFKKIIFIDLMNTDCTVYTMIDETLIKTICEQLQIASILFFASQSLRDYNEQIVFKSIIHVIYFILKINGHAEQICFMLIMSLSNHRIIIDKSWMNRHKVILNILYDRIVFKSNCCKHFRAIFNHVSLKSNQNFASSRRSSTWTLETFVIFVITEILKYIILKKGSVFNQIIKKSAVDSRSIFALLETSTNSVELNSFESRSDLVQACRVESILN